MDKNEADKEFEDEVEAVLQGAREDEDEELPEVSGGGYVVAVYEGQWFLAEVAGDQKNVRSGYTRPEYLAIKRERMHSLSPSSPTL